MVSGHNVYIYCYILRTYRIHFSIQSGFQCRKLQDSFGFQFRYVEQYVNTVVFCYIQINLISNNSWKWLLSRLPLQFLCFHGVKLSTYGFKYATGNFFVSEYP